VAVVRGGVVRVPLGGCAPLQPPEALQLLTLEALHCSVTLLPIGTAFSLDLSVRVGAEISLLVTVPALLVTLVDVPWHAASAVSAVNASSDFNTNAQPTRSPLRIEFILVSLFLSRRHPAGTRGLEPLGQRSHIHSIF
jgi:hypothetical protein